MIYHSTRDEKLTAAPTRAVLEGIAPDGGLYVCDPGKLDFDWQGTLQKDTMSMAADILGVLLPDFQDMKGLVRASYAGKFASDDLTPLVPVGERYVLEEDAGYGVVLLRGQAVCGASEPVERLCREGLVAAADVTCAGIREPDGEAGVAALVRGEDGKAERAGTKLGPRGRVETTGLGAIERLLRGVVETTLAIVVAVGDDEGNTAGDHGRAHLLDGAPREGLDLLRRLVAECRSVALDLVAGQDDEVGPLCVKRGCHQCE